MTSYIKLLTQRVTRLEQEFNRQKKLSVMVVGDAAKDAQENDQIFAEKRSMTSNDNIKKMTTAPQL